MPETSDESQRKKIEEHYTRFGRAFNIFHAFFTVFMFVGMTVLIGFALL